MDEKINNTGLGSASKVEVTEKISPSHTFLYGPDFLTPNPNTGGTSSSYLPAVADILFGTP